MTSRTYSLAFLESALKEWRALDSSMRGRFKKQLRRRLHAPHVTKNRLHGNLKGLYKTKLRASGYRLVYRVHEDRRVVVVVAVGKRESYKVYRTARKRTL